MSDKPFLNPEDSWQAIRELRTSRPVRNFTPLQWREWEKRKSALLERIWWSASDITVHETETGTSAV